MAIKNLKRTKRIENKRIIGLDGSAIDPGSPSDPSQVFFTRSETAIAAFNVGSFPEYTFQRDETSISATRV